MTFHTPNMMKPNREPKKPEPKKIVDESPKKIEEVKKGIPKPLKIGLYFLLWLGVIVGLFFLSVWLIVDGLSTIGKGLGF